LVAGVQASGINLTGYASEEVIAEAIQKHLQESGSISQEVEIESTKKKICLLWF
jgi:hypothetical protein